MPKPKAARMPEVDSQYLQAARLGTLDNLNDALARGADPQARHPGTKYNAMMGAAERSDWAPGVVRRLMDVGVSLDTADEKEQRPVHLFAKHGQPDFVKMALERGEDIEVAGGVAKMTPLMFAALGGDAATVEALLAVGARIDALDRIGLTALHYASTPAAIEVLASRGAAVNAVDAGGRSPLYYGLENRREFDCIERLVRHGADVNVYCGGLTAAHYAAWLGNGQALVLLLQQGADPRALTHTGETVDRLWELSRRRPDIPPDAVAAYDAYVAREAMRTAASRNRLANPA